MIARRTVHLTTAIALATSLAGWGACASASASAAAPSATTWQFASGVGSSLAAAEHQAETTLKSEFTILSPYTLVQDTQEPDGSWYAVVTAQCGNPR